MKLPPHGGDGNFGEFPGEDLITDVTAPTGFRISAEYVSPRDDLLAQLRMGHRAAAKAERTQRCTAALVERHLNAWVAAALHLHAAGVAPLVPLAVSRALWRRGDRALATELARLQGVGT
ncbi:Mycobacterium numidiamassiliense ORFan [Mycobacterium numidiamassiliense]|uniref:Mycobacterium numidiamassiliense ORFan n=1 Tax=Mycobacterium numidiamassiliense TaxID=1841861 RepID=A0A2U3PIP4_9MYCO|nr:hypothetical protein [Mycobacterium numidiamassiliense]SPM43621.1 Mycobacterium numidiamassiliense ORFan [Mycobacterium numidiamassiliense]